MKQINTIRGRNVVFLWIWRLNTIKMSFSPRLFYSFNIIPIKLLASFIAGIDKLIVNFIWKGPGSRQARMSQTKKNRGIDLPSV